MEFNLLALVEQYFNPELMIAVPFLMFIGKQFKLSERIEDTLIVNYLSYIGIVISIIYSCSQALPKTTHECFMMLMVSVLSGVVIAYTSVGAHQQFKQRKENKQNRMH